MLIVPKFQGTTKHYSCLAANSTGGRACFSHFWALGKNKSDVAKT